MPDLSTSVHLEIFELEVHVSILFWKFQDVPAVLLQNLRRQRQQWQTRVFGFCLEGNVSEGRRRNAGHGHDDSSEVASQQCLGCHRKLDLLKAHRLPLGNTHSIRSTLRNTREPSQAGLISRFMLQLMFSMPWMARRASPDSADHLSRRSTDITGYHSLLAAPCRLRPATLWTGLG